jgi:serine/threonine protein kinase
MTREEWLRVKDVTAAALEQPEAARAGFVAHTCEGDEPLEREVRSLLASAISASPLFETPVFATATAASVIADATRISSTRPGARLGAYRIVQEIGRGGMGTVFLAERADEEYRQRVALKPGPEIVHHPVALQRRDRFVGPEHPNIAWLMDGGSTPTAPPSWTRKAYLLTAHRQRAQRSSASKSSKPSARLLTWRTATSLSTDPAAEYSVSGGVPKP